MRDIGNLRWEVPFSESDASAATRTYTFATD
jgi:hypothetical protein